MKDLAELEQAVNLGMHQGADVVCQMGAALTEIRDRKLYKELGYKSFEKYINDKFSMTRARAYHLMSAAEIISDLKPHFDDKALPKNESVVRPLMGCTESERVAIWNAVIDMYPTPKRHDVECVRQRFKSA